jgi:hypothetical protein
MICNWWADALWDIPKRKRRITLVVSDTKPRGDDDWYQGELTQGFGLWSWNSADEPVTKALPVCINMPSIVHRELGRGCRKYFWIEV